MSPPRIKRPSRERRLINTALPEMIREAIKTEGFTPEQRRDRDNTLRQKDELRRNTLWLEWLHVKSWTIRQAGLLFSGHDPNKELLGSSRHSAADNKHILKIIARLKAAVEEHLKPVTRSTGTRLRRYRPGQLAKVGREHNLGYAAEIESLAIRRGLPTEYDVGGLKSRKLTSTTDRRMQVVVELAQIVLKTGIGELRPDGIYLPLTTSQFLAAARKHLPSSLALFACTSKTLARARLDRTSKPQLPRVILGRGRPKEEFAEAKKPSK